MDSGASGLIEAFKAEFGGEYPDWDRIAMHMYTYGSGGICGCATLCGIPNGCCAPLCLLGTICKKLGGEIIGHYSSTEFPPRSIRNLYEDPYYGAGGTGGYEWPWEPIPNDEVLAYTTSNSPLCHVSISKWCYAAGVDLNDKSPSGLVYKNDRCGKICAEMAGYTAELINYYALTAEVEDPYQVSPATADCMYCHDKADNPRGPAQCGNMECTECHTDMTPHEGRKFWVERLWTEAWVDDQWVEANTFSPGDSIRYCLRFSILGTGAVYIRTKPNQSGVEGYKSGPGIWGYYLNKDGNCSDTQTWYWENTVDANASGKARFRTVIQIADTSSGPLLYESPTKMVYFTVE